MTREEEAKELFDKMKGFRVKHSHSKKCAIVCVNEMHDGITYVLGELKARGELSEKMFLKCLDDLIEERNLTIEEIKKL